MIGTRGFLGFHTSRFIDDFPAKCERFAKENASLLEIARKISRSVIHTHVLHAGRRAAPAGAADRGLDAASMAIVMAAYILFIGGLLEIQYE
jgi:hypothetical protein